MNDIKLSIAIPTYNGSKSIQETLNSIIIQFDDIDEKVEIVISDNASMDQTPEIIRDYQKKYPFLKYFRNEENLGADRNFDLAVKRSTGEYVWLFSDNDKMTPCAIRKVLRVIHKYKDLAVIVVNYSIFDEKLGKSVIDRVIIEYNDILFESADAFCDKLEIYPALVSVNIVRKSLWNESNVEYFYFTNWVHVGVIFSILAGRKSFFISNPYVRTTSGPSNWEKGGNGLKYAMRLEDIVSTMDKLGYKKSTSDKILKSFFKRLPGTIMGARENGLVLSLELLRNMCSRYAKYPSFWLIDLPLLLVPNQIYNSKIIRYCLRRLFRISKIVINLWS